MNEKDYTGEVIDEDSENFKSDEKVYGYKEIVFKQLQKVITNTSQEMRSGFWILNNEGYKIKYIGDSRVTFMRSLDALHDLLLPEFSAADATEEYDKRMAAASKRIYGEIETVEKNFDDKSKVSKDGLDSKESIQLFTKALKCYRELFQEICLYLKGKDWLGPGSLGEN